MRKDFKAHEFKKGEMVRFASNDLHRRALAFCRRETLGIVIEQDGMKIQVSWITWPDRWLKPNPWMNAYDIARIE